MQQRAYDPPSHAQVERSGFFPEIDLLLLCSRWPLREEDRQLILATASEEIDWQLFLHLVERHRLVPLVSHTLHASLAKSATSDAERALVELRLLAAESAHESLRSLAELRRIVQKLQSDAIPVRVLKGLPLAQSVFGDLGLRASGDIDMLIEEASIVQTDHVLREIGYHGNIPLDRLTPKRFRFYHAHWKDVNYQNPVTGFEVDLHWRCFRNCAMSGAGLGEVSRSETVSFGGFRVETLPKQENLLYLCVHGTFDGWLYLKALADVAAQVRMMTEAELDSLAVLATEYGILPELTATLVLVRRYMAMDHWSDGLLAANDPSVTHILRYSDRVLVAGRFMADRAAVPVATTMLFELGLRRSLRYRYELLLRVLFRFRMWETIPLPDFLFGLYPFLSPFEWVIYRLRRWWTKPAARATLTV